MAKRPTPKPTQRKLTKEEMGKAMNDNMKKLAKQNKLGKGIK